MLIPLCGLFLLAARQSVQALSALACCVGCAFIAQKKEFNDLILKLLKLLKLFKLFNFLKLLTTIPSLFYNSVTNSTIAMMIATMATAVRIANILQP